MFTDTSGKLTFLDISGSPYDIGYLLGRFGADFVQRDLSKTAVWERIMRHRESEQLEAMQTMVETQFPRYFQELRGLADGLELPFADVFAWNCRGDVWAMVPDGCTTVQLPGPNMTIAHNEDGSRNYLGHCAIARIAPIGGTSFTTFLYPGSLPGHAFFVNEHGLVMTVNNVRSTAGGVGVPRMVLARAMIDCPTLDVAVDLVQSTARAGGFHFTLAQRGDERLLSVEFTHQACSVRRIETPQLHTNHLMHDAMTAQPQLITTSSRDRQQRGAELLTANSPADALAILRDEGGRGLPIWRTSPSDPDDENTLASALFKIDGDRLDWSVYVGEAELGRFHWGDRVPSAA